MNISKLKYVLNYVWKENFRIRNDCKTERVRENSVKKVYGFLWSYEYLAWIRMFLEYLDRKGKQRQIFSITFWLADAPASVFCNNKTLFFIGSYDKLSIVISFAFHFSLAHLRVNLNCGNKTSCMSALSITYSTTLRISQFENAVQNHTSLWYTIKLLRYCSKNILILCHKNQ